jgi:SAM-dependent methyltransferase
VQPLKESLLARHSVYRLLRALTGSDRVNREFVERYVRPREGESILDVGCGPGDVFALMPQIRYVGIDFSEDYIQFARRRFGARATFFCGDIKQLVGHEIGSFDAVLAMGVIHHLGDEEARGMLEGVRGSLKCGGRFVSYDPCFTEPQHPVARWIHQHDRGRHVRMDRNYEKLISGVFPGYRKHIRTDMCTVPATVIIFECPAG